MDFRFQIHHLFSRELFDNPGVVTALNTIFSGATTLLLNLPTTTNSRRETNTFVLPTSY